MLKRTICLLLSACLLVGAIPLFVRAEGETEATTQATETTAPPTETTTPETQPPETTPTVPEDDYTENMTRMSDAAIALLKQYEGFSKYPTWDVSQWSVGYGTRCPGDKLELWKAVGITEREAESLLNGFVNNFGAKLDAFIAKYNLNLNQYQYDALMLFTYNCGAGWMNQTGLLQTAVISGATGNDFIYPFVLWCKADRVFSNGLILRRLAEANLYLNGVYGRTPPANYRYVYFDANGGSADYTVQGFDINKSVPIKVIAAKTYTASNGAVYEFEGWYDKRVGGNKVEILDASRASGSYLYAHWKLIKEGTGSSDGNDPGGTSTLVDVVVTATSLNVRLGPGTQYDYAPPKGYPQGTQLTIVETKSDGTRLWGKVANTGNSGYWVALEYTNYSQVIQSQQPTPPPATQPAPTPTTKPTQPPTTKPAEPESTFGTWVGVVKLNDPGSKLYIRSKPDVNSTSIGYLIHGDKVTIVEQKIINNVPWGKMQAGWVCLNYVSFDPADVNPPQPTEPTPTQPKPTEPKPTEPKPTQTKPTEPAPTQPKPTQPKPTQPKPTEPAPTDPTETDPTTPTETDPSDPFGTEAPETDLPDGDGYWIGVVNTAFLPIRSAAGTVNPIVGYCMRNDSLEIVRCITVDGQLWGKVSGGWICLSFVSLDGEDVLSGQGLMTVNTCSLRVRSGAGVEHTIVAFLSYGDVIAIYARQEVGSKTWGLTDLGWVDLQYLQ